MAETLSKSEGPAPSKASESDQNILLAAKGGGIAFVGNFFVYVFRFAFGILLARLLGAELLGHYTLGLTIVDILTVLSLLGFGAGIVRFIPIAISKKDDLRLWGVIQITLGLPFLLSTILAAGVFLLAEPIALTDVRVVVDYPGL
jgi:O-antigen/teichoic acid export membrane protein